MLIKRLFIGLMILSTLTTEGTIFCNTALAPLQEYIADLYSTDSKTDIASGCMHKADPNLSSVQYKISACIPIAEILKTNNNNRLFYYYRLSKADNLCFSTNEITFQTTVIKIAEIPLNGSDMSPPLL